MKPSTKSQSERGMAMIAVLVILLAVFALCAPFLMSVRNADRASAERSDQAAARLALDSALRHARASLGDSHPGVDETPYFDSLDEFEVSNDFPEDFYNAANPQGTMWDVEAEDLAGLIDLNSASHHTLANLLGGVARSLELVEPKTRTLAVSSASGFDASGFLWLEHELIAYSELADSEFRQLTRGLLAQEPVPGEPEPCGPNLAETHPIGSFVIDQRSFAIPLWRMFSGGSDQLASLDSLEQVGESRPFTMIGQLPAGMLETLQRTSTVHGHVAAGSQWQNPTRLLAQADGEDLPTCRFSIEDTRFMNAGSTLRFTDGDRVEFAIVREVEEQRVTLMDALVNSYDPERTTVSVLARRPVNINTASVEVLQALLSNLKLVGKRARITSSEASDLVKVIVVSRPFSGFADFVKRVVLPAGGFEALPEDAPVVPEIFAGLKDQGELLPGGKRAVVGFIDEDDARALYRNARNANDRTLEFSTLPFTFNSRDLYKLEMRASINAKSGVQRSSSVREQIDLIVPQKPLFKLWQRQEDFEEESRLDRSAQGWASGPEPTTRAAGRFPSRLPSRSLAHMGNYDSTELTQLARDLGTPAIQTYASLEGPAWAQLAPARTHDEGTRTGRVLHFDFETESLEGRYLPDGTLDFLAGDSVVGFTNSPASTGLTNVVLPPLSTPASGASGGPAATGSSAALMNAVSFELWIKPEGLGTGSTFLSAGGGISNSGPFGISDLVELVLDEEHLVLRVRDGLPDHLATPNFRELAEVRYPLNSGPGLPLDVWTHVEVGIAGTRPDQMRLVVDGRLASEATGLTRLTASLGSDGTQIAVESTEGFPNPCVLLIGEELIEATVVGANAFEARFHFDGPLVGYGGRLARETFRGANPEQNEGLSTKQTSYPSGTTVQLYGYSLPLGSEVPGLRGSLSDSIGSFLVGRAVGVKQNGRDFLHVPAGGTGLADRQPTVQVNLSGGSFIFAPEIGFGLPGNANVEELFIESADAAVPRARTLAAFSRSGGYAALMTQPRSFSSSVTGASSNRDTNGIPLGGIEVIRYSGLSDRGLIVAARGDAVPELMLQGDLVGRKSFAFRWDEGLNMALFKPWNEGLADQVFVVPLSLPVSGGVPALQPPARPTELIQLTHLDADAGLTEWVQYDQVVRGSVVRVEHRALQRLLATLVGTTRASTSGSVDPPTPPRLPLGSSAAPPSVTAAALLASAAPAALASNQQQQQSGAYWHYAMGSPELTQAAAPVSAAAASALQFRGVMGTFSHTHQAGTLLLPVFRIPSGGVQRGMPGRFDQVTLFEQLGQGPSRGVPGTVHRAHRFEQYLVYGYQPSGILSATTSTNVLEVTQEASLFQTTLVALDNFTVPIANSNLLSAAAATNVRTDTRQLARMSKFPAGELPRGMERVSLGGNLGGQGSVASAVIDEVVFGTDSLDHQKILDNDVPASSGSLRVRGERYPGGDLSDSSPALSGLRAGSGLISVGDEIMAYTALDPSGNTISIPNLGRGLLGSTPQPHAAGEGIQLMESYIVGTLLEDIKADDASMLLDTLNGFPPSGGLVLIDRELIHYTRLYKGALVMPTASEEPGRMDARGAGIFRGRFGTDAESHLQGTPVILFPFRYWDRWSPRADAPELDFFEFHLEQPGAYLGQVFWEVDEGPAGGVRLGVLQRLDGETPWDSDTQAGRALELMYRGNMNSGGNPIGVQSDSAQWRAFVEYERGAFDAQGGLSHGWKSTPKLRQFGVQYVAPGLTLERIER